MVETFVRVADHYTHSFTFAIENEDIITIEMHKRQKSFRVHIFYGESFLFNAVECFTTDL